MKQQHKLQPKLRFPEFEGDWDKSNLGNISKKPKYGLNSSATEYDGINGYLRITDIDESSNKFIKDKLTSPDSFSDEFLLKEWDLIFTRTGASTGKSYLYTKEDGKLYFAGFLIKFSLKDICNDKFVFYQTKLVRYSKWVKIMSMRSGQPGINSEEYSTLDIILPSLPEQQKIADYLSTIDTKINLLEEKKAQLALYKKAMMQKLFSQEIRFKPTQCHTEPVEVEPVEVELMETYPEWEEKRLGEVVSLKGGYAFKSDLFKENGVSIMRISNISNNNIYIDENNMVYYDDFKISNSYKVFTGELLIALSGATTGKASIYNLENFSYVNQRVGVFKSINKCYYNFIVQYIFSSSFTKELKKMLVAGAQPNISTSEIESIILNMPTSEKEQQKIADFLSAIDES